MTRPWIVLRHTHAYWKKVPTPGDIKAALPPGAVTLPTLDVHDPDPAPAMDRVSWRAAQLRQARRWKEIETALVRDGAELRHAYFGATTIPHALDLGARLRTFERAEVFQQHHTAYDWRWRGRNGEPAPSVHVEGLPGGPDPRDGEVVVRVSASYRITPEQTAAVVPSPLCAIDLRLDPISLDPFASLDELEALVQEFHSLLKQLESIYKNRLRRLHLFVAGPVGLAFRLGGAINPTIYPPVQSWQYVAAREPCYVPAMVIGRPLEQLEMKSKILFLAAEPQRPWDPSQRLHLDREQRAIVKRLEAGKHRDQLELEPRLAAEATELQQILTRARAAAVHFSGHANDQGEIAVEGEGGRTRAVPPDVLIRVFKTIHRKHPLRLVVLNACWSASLARRLAEEGGIPCVIGMLEPIGDDAAQIFAAELYNALADGESVHDAFERAVTQLGLVGAHKKSEHLPKLFHAVDPASVFLVEP